MNKTANSTTFQELAAPHVDALYRTARRMTQSETAAEDLVQDTFLKAFKNFHQFMPGSNFRAWIFKVMLNNFRNDYRRAQVEPKSMDIETISMFYAAHDDDMFSAVPAGNANFETLVSDEVKQAMEELPEEYREVVTLAMIEDFTYQEIADMLEVPIGTVMSRLFRGRQMLKQRLAEYAQSMGYVKRSA